MIERLLLAVQNNDDPGRSPALRSLMSEALERRSSFTKHVENSLPRSQGTRSAGIAAWLDLLEPTKIAADLMVPLLIEAGVAFWKLWRERSALQREGILARLAAQKWRAFVDVPEA